MEFSPSTIWLLAGAVLLVLEFLGAPAVGFLFMGIGAIVTGFLISFGLIEAVADQWIAFFAATIISAIILWKPMKNWRQNHDLNFNDMTGDNVTIIGDLSAGKKGKAKWNGAIMKARLVDGATALKDGAEAEIVSVKGNVLIVK